MRRQEDTVPLSFCIITDGRRPAKLRRELESIRQLGVPGCEVLVGGDPPSGLEGARIVPLPEAAREGRLGAMRNRLAAEARGEWRVVCDDDLVFHPGFARALARAGPFDVLSVRVENPDGSRYWDWCTVGGPRGHRLLGYDETDPWAYVSGAICALRPHVPEKVRWNEGLGFYEGEDVDFSRCLQAAGLSIGVCPEAVVTHADIRYRQKGRHVTRMGAVAARRHWLWTRLVRRIKSRPAAPPPPRRSARARPRRGPGSRRS